VYADHEGRRAVFEFDIAARKLGDLVFSHPVVDVDGLEFDVGARAHVIGVRYTVDRPMIHFFDPLLGRDYRELDRIFDKEFGAPVYHDTISESADGNRQIIYVTSEIQPPIYYLFDRTNRTIGRILEERPELKPANLAPTRRFTYEARDGLKIPAYVTLPRGVEPRNLPAVILIHGGPHARDSIEWDREVQLLANRGFAVLQVNFRGSTGFGVDFLRAGYREWGQKIQDDISDGVKWLIARGIADADRIGIMGTSFGGYATLAGLFKTPQLYRAGVAYAPVTDIETTLKDDKWYDWDYDSQETRVGGEHGDLERLRANSPLRHVEEIRAPVLLGHGENDQRVNVRQSRRMADALKGAGKDYQYLEFPNEVHGFLLESNRVKWYEAVSAFFEKNLAPREKPAGQTQPVAVAAAH
jgi:dipeptidyl aminopeptidase/acylaminoacyl peptidase